MNYVYEDQQFDIFMTATKGADDTLRERMQWAREHEIRTRWRRRCLLRALASDKAKLTDQQRRVVELTLRFNKTQPEISALLGISQQSVSQHMYAAAKKLKKALLVRGLVQGY